MALLHSKATLLPSQSHQEDNFGLGPRSNGCLVELHPGPLAAPCHVGPEHAHKGQRQLRSSYNSCSEAQLRQNLNSHKNDVLEEQ